jgi:Flp pilus assembly pilin Flp
MDTLKNVINRLSRDEVGQGLVEYVLIFALITFASAAGMGSMASHINTSFSTISSIFGLYV